jgi:xylulokinase
MKYLLGIDVGTSGTKVIVVDTKGIVIGDALCEYPLYTIKPGWNEQDPADWYEGAVNGCRVAIKKSGVNPKDIAAIGLSGQMHGLVPLDKDGNVIRRALLWNDQRCEKQCKDIINASGGLDGLLSYTNNNMLPGYQGGKILWIKENEPQNYEKIKKCLLPKDYIRYKLTNEYCAEVSDASGTGFFDVKNRKWSDELINKIGIPKDFFPNCVESTQITGKITAKAAEETGLIEGIPVYGGGGDAVAQTTGMGIVEEGVLGLIFGTSGVCAMAIKDYHDNTGAALQYFCNNEPGLYHAMGVMLAAGGSYQWYRNTLCDYESYEGSKKAMEGYEIMNAAAELSPAGAKRLLYLPYLSGERCPYNDPNLRACFIGLTQIHSKGDITRSVMEGITYGMKHINETIKNLRGKSAQSKYIIASGGGMKSPLWRQITADIFGLQTRTVSGAKEGGAYGAILIAGVGCGIWKNLQEACSIMKTETITDPNPKNKDIYQEMFGIYSNIYKNMKPIFDDISKQ